MTKTRNSIAAVSDDVLVVGLVLVSMAILTYENTEVVSLATMSTLDAVDTCVAVIFLVEFCIRLLSAESKGRFLKLHWWELIASIPISVPLTQGLRVLRILRLLRLVRLNQQGRDLLDYLRRFIRQTHVVWILTVWGAITLSATVAFYQFEHSHSPLSPTLFDSFWWAVSTITTVGYGDVYPVTVGGRIVGIFLMLTGIGMTGIVTALIASFFVKDHSPKG